MNHNKEDSTPNPTPYYYYPSYPTPYYPSPYSPSSSKEPCPAWVPASSAPIYDCKAKEREPCDPWISSDMAPIYNCIPLTPTTPHPTITASSSYPPSISPRPTKSHDPTYAPWTMPPTPFSYPSDVFPPTSTDRNKAVISPSDKLNLLQDNTDHVEE